MPTINTADFTHIIPEMVLAAWGLGLLIVDFALLRSLSGRRRQLILGVLTLLGCLVVAGNVLAPYLRAGTENFASFYGIGEATGPGVGPSAPGASTATADREAAAAAEAAAGASSDAEVPDALDRYIFFGTIASDLATQRINVLIVAMLAMVVGLSLSWPFTEHWGEYFALLCWSAVGMMLLVAAEELLTLFLTLETMTICLYLATAFEPSRRRSAEGGLKYFVYGSVSSAMFLFGLSLLYGLTGSTRLPSIAVALGAASGLQGNVAGAMAVLLLMVGFGFKIAAVPFHQWAPDAYEGAPAPISAWIASGSKVASFVALLKVLVAGLKPWSHHGQLLSSPGWIYLVAIVAALSMTFGNLAALAQRNLKRMLAYSSIAHAGYMLIGVLAASVSQDKSAAGSVLFYLVIYGVTTIGAFGLAAWLIRDKDRDEIDDLNGLGRQSPGLAVCIVILMLSLIGMPPLAGFFGKLYMFMEALNTTTPGVPSLTWLVALGLLNSVVSAFYYVRVLKAMFLRPPARDAVPVAPSSVSWPIVFATAAAVGFGFFPGPLLETMKGAAIPLLSAPDETPMLSQYTTDRDPNYRPDTEAQQRQLEENQRRLMPAAGGSGRSSPPAFGLPGPGSSRNPQPPGLPGPPPDNHPPDATPPTGGAGARRPPAAGQDRPATDSSQERPRTEDEGSGSNPDQT